MNIFEHQKEICITHECNFRYNSMTLDGCNYYFLTVCGKQIIKTDRHFEQISNTMTHRDYCCICYDPHEHCFWAASKQCANKIFKLNSSLREIDCVSLTTSCGMGGITGISYNCCYNSLYITFTGCVAELNKDTTTLNVVYNPHGCMWIFGVISICPGCIIWGIGEGKQFVTVLDESNKPIFTEQVKCDMMINDILFNPCHEKPDDITLEILITKNGCYPYIIRNDIHPCDLGFIPCCCNWNPCNVCCNKKPCTNTDACTDVMKSIALVETSLSHILNTEGEKLQKILATTDDFEKIMCVNKEVNKTIINATHLEHTLYAKLSALSDCDCCKDLCIQDYNCCDDNNICD